MDKPGAHHAHGVHAAAREGVVIEVLRPAPAALALAVQPHALEKDVAVPRIDKAADGLQQSRLAMTVRTEQADARATLHRQRHVAKHLHRLVAARQRARPRSTASAN